MINQDQPISVGQLNRIIRKNLEELDKIFVYGELISLSKASSGHWYFTIKDELGQINCALFKMYTKDTPEVLDLGTQILLEGQLTLYEAKGQYQFIAKSIKIWGAGSKYIALEKLKNKLLMEGLFAQERKKTLPKLPSSIAIISSMQAAGLQDVLVILKRRYRLAKIYIYPSLMQGDQAENSLVKALDMVEKNYKIHDVLLIARGGGASEDLWCFNSEKLARKMASMNIPIITGIGHEIDTTIADLVADLRAPTPSAAAELLVPDERELINHLKNIYHKINKHTISHIQQLNLKLDQAKNRLISPNELLKIRKQKIERLELIFIQKIILLIKKKREKLSEIKEKRLKINSLNNISNKITVCKYRFNYALDKQIAVKNEKIKKYELILDIKNPVNLMKKGWGWIETENGEKFDFNSSKNKIKIFLNEGYIEATITAIHKNNKN